MKILKYKPYTLNKIPHNASQLLYILKKFENRFLTDTVIIDIIKELIKYGIFRPINKTSKIKKLWSDTENGNFSLTLLSNTEIQQLLKENSQNHNEIGFNKEWSSKFISIFNFSIELGFVYLKQNKKIEFSKIGLRLASVYKIEITDNHILPSNIHPEFEQQAFLHALAKSQRNNPFLRVLNENVPLILLLQVIQKLNSDKEFNHAGISKLELPLIIFWKNGNAEELYQLIKSIRKEHRYNPSWEVIVDTCVNKIMTGDFKKFKPKSIMDEYPDEFIRKMRLTGLISLRGGGRFIDINKNEQDKVDYILKKYSKYKKYTTEKEYFDYMAKVDQNLISFVPKVIDIKTNNRYLESWVQHYCFKDIKKELTILSSRGISKDGVLKFLSHPVRLEFLISIAIKSKFPNVEVVPNYPCDDEGIPTSTAGGQGNQGDIECIENNNGILVEVTMSEGRSQTVMEIWPITRHLEKFNQKNKVSKSICYFVAPSIFKDSKRQIKFVKQEDNLSIYPYTIDNFLDHINISTNFYYSS